MKQLKDFEEDIHRCSKCGLCQAECPIYKASGNDCAVSRGQFLMLQGFLEGKFKFTKVINRYIDLCLKCGACSKFCPSGINIVDVLVAAKSEYFKAHFFEKVKTFFQKHFIFGIIPKFLGSFSSSVKSKTFDKKVVFFGGCGSKIKGEKVIIKMLNSIGVEVISPSFNCCGVPYFSRGDLKEFENSIISYVKTLRKYNVFDVVVNCASCEKSLKDYIKWIGDEISNEDVEFLKKIKVKNIYEYLRENDSKLSIKKPVKVTYHKPCNIDNWDDIKWVLENTENLEYIQMQDYDKCCGLNGISKFKEYKILKYVFRNKRNNIKNTGAKVVITSCFGCEIALNSYSLGLYKAYDLLEFISKNM